MKKTNDKRSWQESAAIALIRAYQVAISPLLGPSCRFYPSCSAYALEAIRAFGVIKGSYLILMRILRCQPLCRCGVDFVPEEFTWRPWKSVVSELPETTNA